MISFGFKKKKMLRKYNKNQTIPIQSIVDGHLSLLFVWVPALSFLFETKIPRNHVTLTKKKKN